MADLDATAAARRAATARAVSFLSGSDSDDESLPSLSDEDVDPEELKRIAREEALLACSDVGELAARAAAAEEHAARFEKTGEAPGSTAGGEPEPEPEPEPGVDTARKGIQDQLDAEYGEQQAGVAASKSAAMARMEARQREREAERKHPPPVSPAASGPASLR